MLARSVNPSTGEGEASILVYRVSPIKKKKRRGRRGGGGTAAATVMAVSTGFCLTSPAVIPIISLSILRQEIC